MLHHVRPEPEEPRAFAPNRILEVTSEFLDAVLDQVQEAGFDVISIDEAVQRFKEGNDRRFACFTFDDGYRDNLEYAHPLFKRRSALTTRKGMLFPAHRRHLMALPRVSLSGEYQSLTYTALYLSGAPFALWNRFQRVNAA